jgi:hypothetical protein
MRTRIKESQKTVLIYENAETGKRYQFRKVDSHSYVYDKEDGTKESVGIYAIRKKRWKFIPGESSLMKIRPSV